MKLRSKAVSSGWGHACLRVNNYVADAQARVRSDGLHEYVIIVGKQGPREVVEGSLGKAAAGLARLVLNKYETRHGKGRTKSNG